MMLRNTIYNLIGLGAPLVVAVLAIPVLIRVLGATNFGILTLIWAVVSYLGLFDFGLGRALTLMLSAAEGRGEVGRTGPLVSTALTFLALLGIGIGGLLYVSADFAASFLGESAERGDVAAALRAMAWSIPSITLTSGLRGILEARHAFRIVNAIRLPMGIFTFLGPMVVVLTMAPKLELISWALVIGRWIACLAHAWFVRRLLAAQVKSFQFESREIAQLFITGGWMTISNVVSPLMGYADRFIIAATVSAAAVAYYTTPYELVTKLWVIPAALTSVLFPTFASQVASDEDGRRLLFCRSVSVVGWVLFPLCAALGIFAHEILSAWIGSEFADNSAPLLRVFAFGVLINSSAHIPLTLIQSAGRARWTAAVHLIEVLPFLLILWWSTLHLGVLGAALAWLVRIIVDTVIMFSMAGAILRLRLTALFERAEFGFLLFPLGAVSLSLLDSLSFRVGGMIVILCISSWRVWASWRSEGLVGGASLSLRRGDRNG